MDALLRRPGYQVIGTGRTLPPCSPPKRIMLQGNAMTKRDRPP
jgi:hypothetical protein